MSKCTNESYQLPIGTKVVLVDPAYFRPTEVELLIGDAQKAYTKLNWKPKYNLESLVTEMVKSDLDLFAKDKLLSDHGFEIASSNE